MHSAEQKKTTNFYLIFLKTYNIPSNIKFNNFYRNFLFSKKNILREKKLWQNENNTRNHISICGNLVI